jgi:hypothetical protein
LVPGGNLWTHDGWPNIYGEYAVAFPRALESDELPWRQISSIGNVATMDEELSAGYVINDESVASRAIIKFHLASHATPTLIGREPSEFAPRHLSSGGREQHQIADTRRARNLMFGSEIFEHVMESFICGFFKHV